MQKLRNFVIAFLMIFFLIPAQAQIAPTILPMDEVSLQMTAEQWVSTQTARVIVELNATLDKSNLAQIRKQMTTKLRKIANNDGWHITQFDRSQSQSGLEQVQAQAEVRLSGDQLANLREAAKSVSKPGETYTISQIDFSPSLADIEVAREAVRQQLYQRISAELDRLNKAYPNQHFTIHRINTNFQSVMPEMRPTFKRLTTAVNTMAEPASAPAGNFDISEKVRIEATVVFAAVNKQLIN